MFKGQGGYINPVKIPLINDMFCVFQRWIFTNTRPTKVKQGQAFGMSLVGLWTLATKNWPNPGQKILTRTHHYGRVDTGVRLMSVENPGFLF